MATDKYDMAEALLSDEASNASFLSKSPGTSSQHRPLAQQKIAIVIHALIFLTTLLLLGTTIHLNAKHDQEYCKSDLVPSHNPIANQIRYTTQWTSANHWNNELLWGEPSPEADVAWNNGLGVRGFRLHPYEAARLNMNHSVRLEPGDDFAMITGVLHNLHCLRTLRQSLLYADYYFPNATQQVIDHNRHHNLHCLEAIRTSLMCYPDLNLYAYYWSGRQTHDLTVDTRVTRQCVDWDALQDSLSPRDFLNKDMIRDDRHTHE